MFIAHNISRRGFMVGSAAMLASAKAFAQDFPTKPIRIVTNAVGGGGDFASRQIADALAKPFGQPLIVDNRPGVIPNTVVANSPADGYTLLVNGNIFWIQPLFEKQSYDVLKDFTPITMLYRTPMVLVVHPSVPVNSVAELIALAKAHPGKLTYVSQAPGSASFMAGEMFKYMAGVDIQGVAYSQSAAGLTDLLGGYVKMMFGNGPKVKGPIESGQLKALAVSTAEPSALFPDLPTVASAGNIPGYQSSLDLALFARAGTPKPIIDKIFNETVSFLKSPEGKDGAVKLGAESMPSASPEEMLAWLQSDIDAAARMIKSTGMLAAK